MNVMISNEGVPLKNLHTHERKSKINRFIRSNPAFIVFQMNRKSHLLTYTWR